MIYTFVMRWVHGSSEGHQRGRGRDNGKAKTERHARRTNCLLSLCACCSDILEVACLTASPDFKMGQNQLRDKLYQLQRFSQRATGTFYLTTLVLAADWREGSADDHRERQPNGSRPRALSGPFYHLQPVNLTSHNPPPSPTIP